MDERSVHVIPLDLQGRTNGSFTRWLLCLPTLRPGSYPNDRKQSEAGADREVLCTFHIVDKSTLGHHLPMLHVEHSQTWGEGHHFGKSWSCHGHI